MYVYCRFGFGFRSATHTYTHTHTHTTAPTHPAAEGTSKEKKSVNATRNETGHYETDRVAYTHTCIQVIASILHPYSFPWFSPYKSPHTLSHPETSPKNDVMVAHVTHTHTHTYIYIYIQKVHIYTRTTPYALVVVVAVAAAASTLHAPRLAERERKAPLESTTDIVPLSPRSPNPKSRGQNLF